MRSAILALPLLLAACASPAAQQGEARKEDRTSFSREGIYVGAYVIQSYEDFAFQGASDSDLSGGIRGGYRLSPGLALEGNIEEVNGFSIGSGPARSDLDLTKVGVAAKLFVATERFQPYFVFGGGVAHSSVDGPIHFDHDGTYLRSGFGMDVYLSPRFAVFGEANYNRLMGGVDDLNHVDMQVGLQFRF